MYNSKERHFFVMIVVIITSKESRTSLTWQIINIIHDTFENSTSIIWSRWKLFRENQKVLHDPPWNTVVQLKPDENENLNNVGGHLSRGERSRSSF